ncbi:MAG: hypothetical protein Q4F95_13795, partial [Oscillospiraceae bacterium]|nr:hypothetical protein [Oscillospiraceae bacterium]
SGSMMQGRNMMNQGNMMQEQNIMPVQDNSQNGNIFEPGGTGKLIVNVTTLRKLFPVVGADVTVFTGTYEDMDIIDTSRTDESGKSKVFSLAAPSKSMSLDPDENGNPYKPYNVLVVADGYIPNIHMNIPIFDSITSLQNSDLVYISASGGNPTPRITDESSSYTL